MAGDLDGRPAAFDAWDGYAEFCLFLGDRAEYRRARNVLLENAKAGGRAPLTPSASAGPACSCRAPKRR